MNPYLAAAGILCFLIGLVHTALGEVLVFQRLRAKGAFIPAAGGTALRERHVRILWASWHLVTVFGWCIAAALAWLAQPAQAPLAASFPTWAIAVSLLAGAFLVLVGTKGRHPGWLGLLAAAALVLLAILRAGLRPPVT